GGAGGDGEAEAGVDAAALDRQARLDVDAAAELGVGGDALLEDRQAHAALELRKTGVRRAAAPQGPLVVGEAGGGRARAVAGGLAQVQLVHVEGGGAGGLAGAG